MENNNRRKPQFKLSQSFHIREGWLDKGFREMRIANGSKNIFSKADGTVLLGVGSNMVSAIRYWMETAGLFELGHKAKPILNETGLLLSEMDPYLLAAGSLELIHANIVGNILRAPLFYFCFNVLPVHASFSRESFVSDFGSWYRTTFNEASPANQVGDDFSVLVKSYISEQVEDPEDNLNCPLSFLELIKEEDGGYYSKRTAPLEKLDPSVFYYLLKRAADADEESFEHFENIPNGPARLFNLDRDAFMAMLGRLKSDGYLNFIRTAGLNVVQLGKDDYPLEKALKDMRRNNRD